MVEVGEQVATPQRPIHAFIGLAQLVVRVPPGPGLAQPFRPWTGPVASVGAFSEQVLVLGVPCSERGHPCRGFFLGADARQLQAQLAQRLACGQARVQGQVRAHVALDMYQAPLDLHLGPEVLQSFHQF